jgi:hypothetical protein
MGYTTDFLGHMTISPPLNPREVEYLSAFTDSRRWDRPDGPYSVPDNPCVDDDQVKDLTRFNRPGPGQPGLHCQWTPCPEGCCLTWDGTEKFYEPTAWLGYLIDHFLKPGAVAAAKRALDDEGFSFDHVVNGVVVACRRDTRRLWMIRACDNVVSEADLEPGADERAVWGPFPTSNSSMLSASAVGGDVTPPVRSVPSCGREARRRTLMAPGSGASVERSGRRPQAPPGR